MIPYATTVVAQATRSASGNGSFARSKSGGSRAKSVSEGSTIQNTPWLRFATFVTSRVTIRTGPRRKHPQLNAGFDKLFTFFRTQTYYALALNGSRVLL